MTNKLTNLMMLAEAQILGFYHRDEGGSMRDLVSSMGLKRDEWEVIWKETSCHSYLPEELQKDIEEYLEEEND